MEKGGGREGLWLPRLKAERLRAGMRQEDLQKESGVSRGTLVKLETGRKPVQARTASKLAEALGVSIRRLEGEEESIVPEAPLGAGLPGPGAPQSPREAIEGEYLTVYVGDRTEEEVLTEVRRWYRLMSAARVNVAAGECSRQPEAEDPETE